jgi:peptidoglycan/LPS O-acetylase OafA/YrhL
MPHIKSLDGIRGVAILSVFLFHAGLFAPGWIGVQLFFVLSGFLITNILLKEKSRPLSPYLVRFYWRRSLRIFPLYFLFVLIAFIVYALTAQPSRLSQDWPYLITYTVNFARLRNADIDANFVHLWSLAVEEQFYLTWPLVVYFMRLSHLKRLVLAILVAGPMIRLGLYEAFQGSDPDWVGRNIYCLPISQFDAFAAGGAISAYRLEMVRAPARWLLVCSALTIICGAACLAFEHFVYRDAIKWSLGYPMYLLPCYGFVWGYSLLNAFSAALVVTALQPNVVANALQYRPLVRLGRISYGIYVYHVPVLITCAAFVQSKSTCFAISAALTIIIAELSFRFFESPFLRAKGQWSFADHPRSSSAATAEPRYDRTIDRSPDTLSIGP